MKFHLKKNQLDAQFISTEYFDKHLYMFRAYL